MKRARPRSIKGRFSELFSNTRQLVGRPKTAAFSKARLPPLSERSESSEVQITSPSISASENPSISAYLKARPAFALERGVAPPADPLPSGPFGTNPLSVLPKVQIPFLTQAGSPPRAVEIERLKRHYLSQDITQLLEDRDVNFAEESKILPSGSEFKPVFDLWEFDDDSFDSRTVEDWLSLGVDKDGRNAGIPCKVFTPNGNKWVYSIAYGYDERSQKWFVKFPGKEQDDEWIPRLRLLFLAEDPAAFADRIANAVNERKKAETWLRFCFYVESMPVKAMPEIPEHIREAIMKIIPTPRKTLVLNIEPFYEEAQIHYKYSFNINSFSQRIKNDPAEARSLGLLDLTKPSPPPPRKVLSNKNFQNSRELYGFNSLYTKDSIPPAIMKTRISCLDVANSVGLNLKLSKTFHLDEFQQIQTQSIAKTKKFLTEEWVQQIGKDLRNDLSGGRKGFFNLDETDREVYNMSKFYNFLGLISSMMVDSARQYVMNTFHKFDLFLIDLSPESITINSPTKVDVKFPKHSTGAMINPLFEIDMVVELDKIAYSLDPIKFRETCLQLLTAVVDSVHSIPIIEPKVLPYMFRNVILTISTINENENYLVSHKNHILSLLDSAINSLNEYLKTYDIYAEFIKLDHGKFNEQLNNEQPTLDQCRQEIKQHMTEIEEIQVEVPKRIGVGLFVINVTAVRTFLINKRRTLIKSILDFISRTAKNSFKKIMSEYHAVEMKLLQEPKKIEELDQTRQYMLTVPASLEKLHARTLDQLKYYDFLDDYFHAISQDDFNTKWLVYGRAKHCNGLMEKTRQQLDGFFVKFEQELEAQMEKFQADLDKLSRDVSAISKFTDFSRCDDYHQEVRRVSKLLDTADKEAKQINGRQVIFQHELTDFSRIAELKRTFEPFALLWPAVDQWVKIRQSIQDQPIIQLNADNITRDLQICFQALHKSTRNFRDGPQSQFQIATDFKNEVVEMRDHVPLLTCLLNPGMKPRHWTKLSQSLGFEFALDEEITLNDALKLKLEDKIELVQEVVSIASKEYSIETALQKMYNEWDEILLEIEPYKNTGTFVLKGSDDIIQKLDDDMVMTNTMAFSPYKKPFEDKLMKWEATLKLITYVIEEWLTCQRQWLGLEPIFSSDDIVRQLPKESEQFQNVDKSWRRVLDNARRNNKALKFCPNEKLLEEFRQANKVLTKVQRGLNDYLESKRVSFPRFYFLSDDELLSILSQTKDPTAVQRHLRRCFENVGMLTFEKDLKITQMISCEGEVVDLIRTFYPEGNVEFWLLEVEAVMRETLQDIAGKSFAQYSQLPRTEWVFNWPAQIVLLVAMIYWTRAVEEAISKNNLAGLFDELNKQMIDLTKLVRNTTGFLELRTLSCLIVLDVHAHDVVENMLKIGVDTVGAFEWMSVLRYYWEKGTALLRMLTYEVEYGYEYLGNTSRLVITPLTDRCYLTLTSALQLNMGGAPQGPAGTGKTETTKDLAKAVAFQCVVYNCSETVDIVQMGIFLTGLASCGAWACFDEFNRIYIEVLSVIAQQITTIQNAIQSNMKVFRFERRDVKLSPKCAVFITMNPGYAGRTELPDNLKALFRPVAMMVPDYRMIAEIKLYSFGFEEARPLSEKIVATFRLSSEQLSSQRHYDFGMRAVNTVIQTAGNLRRNQPDMPEQLIVLRAIKDVNVPKFLVNDLVLFNDIISDLFPGQTERTLDYTKLIGAINEVAKERKLQVFDLFINKIIQLYETFAVRWGVMIVGPTGSGKTQVFKTLAASCTKLAAKKDKEFSPTKYNILNPKSITMGQLYGEFNPDTHEWANGILSEIIKICSEDEGPDILWTVLDGPVDALWIENMNTVLDDNKKLCLSSSAVINFTDRMMMLFEVEDLAVASPATVSRCGMVYMEPNPSFRYLFDSWTLLMHPDLRATLTETIGPLFDDYFVPALKYLREKLKEPMRTSNSNIVQSFFRIIHSIIFPLYSPDPQDKIKDEVLAKLKNYLPKYFWFALVWSIGSTTDNDGRKAFDAYLRPQISASATEFPQDGLVYDYRFNPTTETWQNWMETIPVYHIPSNASFTDIVVPTIDNVRHSYLLDILIRAGYHFFCTGPTGTAKTITVTKFMMAELDPAAYIPISLTFSARTNANQTQDIIDSKFERRMKGVFGPLDRKRAIIFFDDTNMPAKEVFGAQPPIELLRQWIDHGGWYDRKLLEFHRLVDSQLICACGHPGGGRQELTPRFMRHFNIFNFVEMEDSSLAQIFKVIIENHLSTFDALIQNTGKEIVDGTIAIYNAVRKTMLPIPSKSHYTFNLRDVSKVVQGICSLAKNKITGANDLIAIWVHESTRVFSDRLVDDADRTSFHELIAEECNAKFNVKTSELTQTPTLLFCDFYEENNDARPYIQVREQKILERVLNAAMADYDELNAKKLALVLFPDAIEHVVRISRIIRQPSGHALLLGVGGSGRQSLTRLASHISEFQIFQPEITKTYGTVEWLADIRAVMKKSGFEEAPTIFLVSDAQIVNESFLEDLNNLLNSGDVPNIFPPEDTEEILEKMKPIAQALDIPMSKPALHALFISRVKANLHIVLALSPIGEAFRRRLRMFPSLVTCTSIDWFSDWSKDALHSVALEFFVQLFTEDSLVDVSSDFSVKVHSSVIETSGQLLAAEKRHNYVTPTSFLDFLQLIKYLINMKMREMNRVKSSMETGLASLQVAEQSVNELQEQIRALQPQLEKLAKDTEEAMERIQVEEAKASEVRKTVEEEATINKAKAVETQKLEAEAKVELDKVLPVLEEAQRGVGNLTTKAIATVRSYLRPPEAVANVMQGVCILLSQEIVRVQGSQPGVMVEDWWATAQKMLVDPKFKNRLLTFTSDQKDHIPEPVIQKLQPLINSDIFTYQNAEKAGEATLNLYQWVIAMNSYHFANKMVQPKKEALARAQAAKDASERALKESQARLRKIERQIAQIREEFERSNNQLKEYMDQQKMYEAKLLRAESLLNNLSGEKGRWEATLADILVKVKNLNGDVLISAASVAYTGPFPSEYRAKLVSSWTDHLTKENVPLSANANVINTLQDPVEVLRWNLNGLPRDSISLENTIIITTARRWPLCIDPQGQANRFIRNLEKENNMEIVKLTDETLVRTLENSIRFGKPLLIENVPEELDPILDPVLMKQVYKQSGADVIKIGDTVIPYHWDFRLYITTQFPSPHYSPELSAKVTLLDFTCTPAGLEEQLLALVVAKERPDLEEMKSNLVIQNSKNKKKLHEIQAKMLGLLENTDPNKLLDDLDLINTLTESNTMSQNIQKQVKESDETEKEIDKSRQLYQVVAFRGSLLFFCISNLFHVDPMYQYSLAWYINFFGLCIDATPPSEDLTIRLNSLIETSTVNFYNNICRSLFERHKPMFAFLLCYRIMQGANEIDARELRFLIAGPAKLIEEGENPAPNWLTSKSWYEIKALDQLQTFSGIQKSFTSNLSQWKEIFDAPDASKCKLPDGWEEKLTLFQRLLVLRTFRADSISAAIQILIAQRLGKQFIESPQFDLSSSFDDSTVGTPLIFVLSVGADPATDLLRFAEKKNFTKKLSSMSLGQGQGEKAEERMLEAMDRGHWLLLQNCHLAVSWLPRLEVLIERIKPDEINRDFRLWLTSMPSDDFPVAILQRGVKMTNEPPKGMKANILRSMLQYDDKILNDCSKPTEYHKLVYSLCFFHALILERRKYGPLGFNQQYDWTTNDLEISQRQLKMFLDLYSYIPFKVLTYLTGEINYGGRVTDDWDRRTLLSILADFLNADVIKDDYLFTENPRYLSLPEQSHKMYLTAIRDFPINDEPDIFGLHGNAEVSYQQRETYSLFENLLLLQSRVSASSGEMTREEQIYLLASDLLKEVPIRFNMKEVSIKYPQKYEDSMNTVLVQQCDMYNKLLRIVKQSLKNLLKALKGIVVMSGELEQMADSLYDNQVPVLWENAGYPSTKPLSGWMADLKKRVAFVAGWVNDGPPHVFWISGFFMQQSFLTGIKQNSARKQQIGVDTISFGFEVVLNPDKGRTDGVYISGLFIEGASWNAEKGQLADPRPKELFQEMPPILLIPISDRKSPETGVYLCPVYKVGTRRGTLSTTGHSTNYVLSVELPTDKPQSYWIKRGVAMICSLSY